MIRRLLEALALLGAIATLVLSVGFRPPFLAVIGRDAIILAIGAGIFLLGIVMATRVTSIPDDSAPLATPQSESPTYDERFIGKRIENALERPSLADSRSDRSRRAYARTKAHQRVRHAVLETLQSVEGVSHDDAERALETGTWTDNPRAQAYLSASVSPPFRIQLVDWLSGRTEQRQLEATLAALDELAATDEFARRALVSDSQRPQSPGAVENRIQSRGERR